MKDSIDFGKAIVDVLKEFLHQTTLGAILAFIAISLWLVFFYPSLPIVTYFAVFVTAWLVLNIIHDFNGKGLTQQNAIG